MKVSLIQVMIHKDCDSRIPVTNIIPNKYTMAKRTGLWTGVNKNELQDIAWAI